MKRFYVKAEGVTNSEAPTYVSTIEKKCGRTFVNNVTALEQATSFALESGAVVFCKEVLDTIKYGSTSYRVVKL
jgi:hypothetical protein